MAAVKIAKSGILTGIIKYSKEMSHEKIQTFSNYDDDRIIHR